MNRLEWLEGGRGSVRFGRGVFPSFTHTIRGVLCGVESEFFHRASLLSSQRVREC